MGGSWLVEAGGEGKKKRVPVGFMKMGQNSYLLHIRYVCDISFDIDYDSMTAIYEFLPPGCMKFCLGQFL